jgi:hypothetical protein
VSGLKTGSIKNTIGPVPAAASPIETAGAQEVDPRISLYEVEKRDSKVTRNHYNQICRLTRLLPRTRIPMNPVPAEEMMSLPIMTAP